MDVTVYGVGNQELMANLVDEHMEGVERSTVLGGAYLAMKAAEAGHDVILCDPRMDLPEEARALLEDAGVELSTDDETGAEHGEVHVFFTPFGGTVPLVKELMDSFREEAVLATTCTCPPMALYYGCERELRTERKDLGVSSFHPAGIPGVETQTMILVASDKAEEADVELATREQVERLLNLAEDMGFMAVELDPELVPVVGDMGIVMTVRIMQAIVHFFQIAKICGAPDEMIEEQVINVLSSMAYLIAKEGLDVFYRFSGDVLYRSLVNMALEEMGARIAECFHDNYVDLMEGTPETMRELSTMMVPPSVLAEEVEEVAGKAPVEHARRRFFRERRGWD